MRRNLVLLLLLAVLVACGPTATPTPTIAPQPSPTARAPLAPATPIPAKPLEAEAAIVYSRSGGFAGVSEEWQIHADGRVVGDKGQVATLAPERVAGLLSELEGLGFFGMRDSYGGGALSPCRDCFTYRLTVSSDGRTKTITSQDGATGTPSELWQALQKVRELIAQS